VSTVALFVPPSSSPWWTDLLNLDHPQYTLGSFMQIPYTSCFTRLYIRTHYQTVLYQINAWPWGPAGRYWWRVTQGPAVPPHTSTGIHRPASSPEYKYIYINKEFKDLEIVFKLFYYSFITVSRNIFSVAAPKVLSIFRESFAKILSLKIESFRNFATIFKFSLKIVIPKFWQKWKYWRA